MATKKSSKETSPKKPKARKSVIEHAKETVTKFIGSLSDDAAVHPELNSFSLSEVMSRAWDKVKDPGDPSLANVAPDYRGVLHAHATSALKANGTLLQGDTQLARFESAVNQL